MYNTNSYVPILTADGSMTLLDQQNDLHFRSLRGARSESEYVFFESSRLQAQSFPWTVLELGLGTGLNFLVTATHALQQQHHHPAAALVYHVVEANPLPLDAFEALGHATRFAEPLYTLLYQALSQTRPGQVTEVHTGPIRLFLYHGRWQETALPESLAVHSIYHDPFGPKDNPDCGTADCFRWSGRHLRDEGRLVTYAANTPLRRAMVEAGLYIAAQRGSQLKREMTVASPRLETLKGYDGVEVLRKQTYYLACLERRPRREDLL